MVLLLLALPSLMAAPRTDPETNVIRLLHLGKAWYQAGTPGPVFFQDPKVRWIPVPAHAWSMGKEAFRMLRLYLPRSKERFLDEFDVVVICGMEALHLRPDFQEWLKEGMEQEGIGFVMADDSSSFGTSGTHTSWYIVPLGDLLPVEDKPVGGSPYGSREAFHIIPAIPGHEFTRNIPWNEVWVIANNRPWPREGSTVVTRMSEEHVINRNGVQMVYWDLGPAGGRSVAWMQAWNANPEFWRWRYSYDVIAHVAYYAARAEIPEDLVLMHNLRSMIGDYYFNRVYAISTLEFADKFKANTRGVEAMLKEVEDAKKEADRMFVDQEYEGSSAVMSGLLVDLEGVIEMAIEAKDNALFWIFVIEWFVVTGTSMVAGALLWSLMVRRRLYHEVGETRLGRRA
jgi:hypothetical protein